MIGLVGRRLLVFVATVLGAAVLLQILLLAAPGDPIDLVPNGEDLRAELEAEWHLDRPPAERIAASVGAALRGDLGTSLSVRPGAPVRELIAASLPRSAGLLVGAFALGLGAAFGLAWSTAGRPSRARWILQLLSVPPVFLLAWMLVVGLDEAAWYAMSRGWISRPDWFALPDQASALRTALAIGVLAIGSGSLFEQHAACEEEILRVRQSRYVEAARALGTPTTPHVLANLLAPLASLAASRVAWQVGGLVVIEKVLLLGGAGSLLWDAALQRDYPLSLGLGLVAAVVVATASLAADLLRLAADPRLRRPAL